MGRASTAEQLTNGGNGSDDFTELELVENCSFSSSVETNHQDAHLLFAP